MITSSVKNSFDKSHAILEAPEMSSGLKKENARESILIGYLKT